LFVYYFSVCEYCAIQQLCNYLLHRCCFAAASLQCPVIDFDRHIIKNAASPEDKQKTAGNSRNNRVPGLFIIDILLSLSSLSSPLFFFFVFLYFFLMSTQGYCRRPSASTSISFLESAPCFVKQSASCTVLGIQSTCTSFLLIASLMAAISTRSLFSSTAVVE